MHGMRTPDHDCQEAGGKKHKGFKEKSLNLLGIYDKICIRDILYPCSLTSRGPKDQKEVNSMTKYELALIVNAKIDDEERAAVVEKAKQYIERFNGTVTEVEEWGRKRLAYEIQKMREGFYYFIQFEADTSCPAELEKHVRIMDNVLRYLIVKKED